MAKTVLPEGGVRYSTVVFASHPEIPYMQPQIDAQSNIRYNLIRLVSAADMAGSVRSKVDISSAGFSLTCMPHINSSGVIASFDCMG